MSMTVKALVLGAVLLFELLAFLLLVPRLLQRGQAAGAAVVAISNVVAVAVVVWVLFFTNL